MLSAVHAVVCLALIAVSPEPDAVILGLSDDPEVLRRLNVLNDVSLLEPSLSTNDVLARLTGIEHPDASTLADLTAKADAADQLDTEFKEDAAKAIRDDILETYEHHGVVDTQLQRLAARVLHNRGAASLSNGNEREAIRDFVAALRRFPDIALDARRYPPPVQQAFKKAFAELRRVPQTQLTITTTRPGTAMLDGRPVGDATTTITRSVPRGHYMLWVRDVGGQSLVHPVEIGATPITVTIDFEFERELIWAPTLIAPCKDACNTTLSTLARKTGISRAIGIRVTPRGTSESLSVTSRGESQVEELRELDALINPPIVIMEPSRHVSPWSFVPAGVGQFKQHRPLVGGLVAGATAAAVTWNIIAAVQRNPGHDNDSRGAQNLSASVLVGVVLAGVAEAVIHDLTHEPQP